MQRSARRAPGVPTLAPVTITAAAVVARLQQPALQVPDGFVSQVLATAGLRWRPA
jgi:hypothetical protein